MLMKVLIFVFSTACITKAEPVDGPKDYPRFIHFPDGEGIIMQKVDLEEEPNLKVLGEIIKNPANDLYLLYTRCKPDSAQTLIMNNTHSITSSYFNPTKQTVVIVHGWLGNQNTDINRVIRGAYLDKSDVNVIVLDWRRLAESGYVTAVAGVPAVGRGLGQFLEFLSSVTGASYGKMHLIGFSLGAHLVGNAGRELRGRVARITGLDPAGPLWNFNSNRLSAADGIYVEAIHTNGGGLGLSIGTEVGDTEFFPNGGRLQPGCRTPVCNHNRAWELFAATVTFDHLVGNECSNSRQITLNTCRGKELHMGNDNLSKNATGWYRVNTRRKYPF